VIEAHPTRKKFKRFLYNRFKGRPRSARLDDSRIDAITAALTGYLYLEGKTELIGNEEEGYIVVPMKTDWEVMRL